MFKGLHSFLSLILSIGILPVLVMDVRGLAEWTERQTVTHLQSVSSDHDHAHSHAHHGDDHHSHERRHSHSPGEPEHEHPATGATVLVNAVSDISVRAEEIAVICPPERRTGFFFLNDEAPSATHLSTALRPPIA